MPDPRCGAWIGGCSAFQLSSTAATNHNKSLPHRLGSVSKGGPFVMQQRAHGMRWRWAASCIKFKQGKVAALLASR